MATDRYICIHGHFYQPPRENPWLERIDLQESAHPFHDWNERILRECYGPNASARILDDQDRIAQIVSNYAAISFNFGPTLLSWLERHDAAVYRAIQQADRDSARRFGGHGSAMAQAWGHAILPLCNARDKRTQIHWGVRDFEHRFGRPPEGLWLPETAVDTETLDVLADCGVRFTVLSPHQAIAVRAAGSRRWANVDDGGIDTRRAYRCVLPSGRSIALFFYDGGISQAVAFERLLARGDRFSKRLLGGFAPDDDGPQLVHIATDGETYGHHHEFGDMALAWALDAIAKGDEAQLTNYGEFLERHPPTDTVKIRERSAWSCAHGVGRWSADCGCRIGAGADWNQAWRAPLRDALDVLRDAAAERFESDGAELLAEPWKARDAYIDVLLEDSPARRSAFLRAHARSGRDASDDGRLWRTLELQRQALLMYTSCGWFFDDLAGIETVQILRYAARGLELYEALYEEPTRPSLRDRFVDVLSGARSNRRDQGDGRRIFTGVVADAAAGLERIAASVATRLLFDDASILTDLPAVTLTVDDRERRVRGTRRLETGSLALARSATAESARLTFAALYDGEHDLLVGVRPRSSDGQAPGLAPLLAAFESADAQAADVLRAGFEGRTWSLGGLLADERRFALGRILEGTLDEIEAVYRNLLENHAALRRSVAQLGSTQPLELRLPAELVWNKDLLRTLEQPVETFDPLRLRGLIEQAAEEGLSLDLTTLGLAAGHALSRAVARVADAPDDRALVLRVEALVAAVLELPFHVDRRGAQDVLWQLRSRRGGCPAVDALAERLGLRVD